jgi:hypothetical protein
VCSSDLSAARASAVSSIHILLILLGCPAEQLGIELPPGGAEAISPEDLRRDHAILARDGARGFADRMRQMHAEVDGACAVRPGSGRELRFVATDPLSQAALISLAKAADTAAGPVPTLRLCTGGEGTLVRLSGQQVPGGDLDWRAAATETRELYQREVGVN